jgi:hypothetical protein
MKPEFLSSGRIQVSVDTSGYCQARCALCVWPELKSAKRIMSNDEFKVLLSRFEGYEIEEFAFNSINEPFVDKTVIEKIHLLIDSGLTVRSLFFSSNWLIPEEDAIEAFADAMRRAAEAPSVRWLNLNATISGIDDASYDELQAGRFLEGVQMPYRPLNFAKARKNVSTVAKLLEAKLLANAAARFHIKAYGNAFSAEAYHQYWTGVLQGAGVSERFIQRHIVIALNHGLTSFGRSAAPDADSARACAGGWLDRLIVVGPDGHVGLCCNEGAHLVNLGNLVQADLETLVAGDAYQRELAIVTGASPAPEDHACVRCEHFIPCTKAKQADQLTQAQHT